MSKNIFWKIYFWLVIINEVISDLWFGLPRFWEYISLFVFLPSIAGFYAFIWHKKIFNDFFWKIYFFIQICWATLYFYFIPTPEDIIKAAKMSQFALATVSIIFLLPLFIALFLHAFRKKKIVKENENYLDPIAIKNRRMGIFCLFGPLTSIFIVLTGYALVSYIFGINDLTDQRPVAQIANYIIKLLIKLIMPLFLAGIPAGIIYLRKKENEDTPYDERSGKGKGSEAPKEIVKWSWGAAGLSWIWGIFNGVWLTFFMFIPVFNVVWWIVLGLKGNRWAWQNNRWVSVEQFKRAQKKWSIWGLVIFFLNLAMSILLILIGANAS